jgi:diguanylate cyclase (GGDEF)-like protein
MLAIINPLLRFLERRPAAIRWAIVVLFVVLLGFVDYVTGFESSFAFFYLLPVALAAWTISGTAGFILSIMCAIVWLVANLLAGEQYSNTLIPIWNALTRSGFYLIFTLLLSEFQQLLKRERSLARTDYLTGTLNSRAFYDIAAAEIARASRYQDPVTILYIDLDNFKSINDQYGHAVGDILLQVVAQTIIHNTRPIDFAARLGGDEFTILLPKTDDTEVKVIAPRLQEALLKNMKENHWQVTFSIGALTCRKVPADSQALIKLADQLMYRVKSSSKNGIGYALYDG